MRFLGVVVSSSLAAALRARFLLGVADSGVLLAEAPKKEWILFCMSIWQNKF